jgi:hypothetical protein
MDGIITTPASSDTRSLKDWIEDQIHEARARQDSFGKSISSMAEIRAFKAVLDRIEETKTKEASDNEHR